ncbi:MFS general substrate transporter [Lecanosticta acicola]|uniref:MFS general substrate transporter n=1 Tax=Lecanosticta acicola TaxID=111012 RepID=A0AAI8W245_9PEZI|nr:MFS general substrate transporter [Lecanosticta acicola]
MSPTADPTRRGDSVEGANETSPLLAAPEFTVTRSENGKAIPSDANGKASNHGTINRHDSQEEAEAEAEAGEEEKPMPYVQILLLCYASLSEPVAYFSIFPFINEMISRTGDIPEENVGFWAGIIESLFSLVQMLLMIFYGRLADRLGRKPVLVFSLAGVSVASALFGLSTSLWQMIFFRCFAGVFAGTVVTMRTMISENCTKLTQGRAFSWYMFTRNLGIFVGPLIGGALANPATQFPGVFGHIQFFKDFPYALASFVAGAMCLTGMLSSLFGLKETLKKHDFASGKLEPPMSTWEVLKAPGVITVLYIFSHTMLLALAYTAVMPTFLFTRIELGGIGFGPDFISYAIALAGASQALWMLLVFPPLQRKIGTGNLLRACAIFWPVFMAASPIYNELLRHGFNTAFWVIAPLFSVLGSGVSMAFACVQLCLNDISPSPTVLATVNALALTLNSGVRAVAPALFNSIFATGIRIHWADGHLVWFILVALALLLNVPVCYLPEAAEGRPIKQKKPSPEEAEGETIH